MSNQDTPADGDVDADRDDASPTDTTNQSGPPGSDDRTVDSAPTAPHDRPFEDVVAQVEVLQEENRRLRAEYVRAQQSEYRRAAIALVVLSGVAATGGVIFSGVRATLFGLAGIGFVTAILIYYLTPQQVATATVGERAYTTLAMLEEAISADLGLQETQVYVPTSASGATTVGARLFVPLHTSYTVPNPELLDSVFVVETDDQMRGISVPPTGALLLRECRQTMVDNLAPTPRALLDQLTEAIVAGFELAEDAVAEVDAADGTATIGIRGSTFGDVDRFDHPLPSFVATGLAVGLQTPVECASITTTTDFEYVVTYTWDPQEVDTSTDTTPEA